MVEAPLDNWIRNSTKSHIQEKLQKITQEKSQGLDRKVIKN